MSKLMFFSDQAKLLKLHLCWNFCYKFFFLFQLVKVMQSHRKAMGNSLSRKILKLHKSNFVTVYGDDVN